MLFNSSTKFIFGVILVTAIFVTELIAPFGTTATVAYMLATFYLFTLQGKRNVIILATIASMFLVTGYFITTPQTDLLTITINRIFALVTIWVGVYFTIRYRQISLAENEQREHLLNLKNTLQKEITNRIETEKKLNKSQHLYKEIVHHFPDGIIAILDTDLKSVMSDGMGLLHHGSRDSFDTAHTLIGSVDQTLLKKALLGKRITFEASHDDRTFQVIAVPLPDLKSNTREILVVFKDITELKMMESNLKRALEKEKNLNSLRSRFVTMASHEFRTPLTTILSSVFLLANYTGADYAVKKSLHINKIKRAVHGLTELLNEFLSLGKLEEGKVKVACSETLIKEYADELLIELDPIKKTGQIITFQYFGKDIPVLTDQQLLKNILNNLLSNAIKYSPPDSEIEFTISLKEDNMQITVSDHGIGIPHEEQRHIFKRFYRAANVNNIEGTGLGLNIARKYIRLLKGSISFQSEIEKGTTFDVSLPVIVPDKKLKSNEMSF